LAKVGENIYLEEIRWKGCIGGQVAGYNEHSRDLGLRETHEVCDYSKEYLLLKKYPSPWC